MEYCQKMGITDSKMVISGVYKDELSMDNIINNQKMVKYLQLNH